MSASRSTCSRRRVWFILRGGDPKQDGRAPLEGLGAGPPSHGLGQHRGERQERARMGAGRRRTGIARFGGAPRSATIIKNGMAGRALPSRSDAAAAT